MLCVSSSVRAPMRAAASAASVPAWPPPMTMTSKDVGESHGIRGPVQQLKMQSPIVCGPLYEHTKACIAPHFGVLAAGGGGWPWLLGSRPAALRRCASPGLQLSPCRLEHPAKLVVVVAECGGWPCRRIPLTRRARIALRVARVSAINEHGRPDPLFLLAGGPGMAATTFYTGVAPYSNESIATGTSCWWTSAARAPPIP